MTKRSRLNIVLEKTGARERKRKRERERAREFYVIVAQKKTHIFQFL